MSYSPLMPEHTIYSNVIGQMFINPNPPEGQVADQVYRENGQALTNDQIKAIAGNTNGQFYFSDIITVMARCILAEEKTERGQRMVARAIFNRFVSLSDITPQEEFETFFPANQDKFSRYGTTKPSSVPSYVFGGVFDYYKKIMYEGSDSSYQFHGMDHNHARSPYGQNNIQAWQRAYDLAYCLAWFIDFDCSGTIKTSSNSYSSSSRNGQVRFIGYEGDVGDMPTEQGERYILDSLLTRPDAENKLAAGHSGFYNNDNWVNNELGQLKVSSYKWSEPPYVGDSIINTTRIPTQSATAFLNFLISRVGCGYAYGAYGQMCDDDLIDRLKVKNPSEGDNLEISRSKWRGRYVCDCSGLIKWFLLKNGIVNCDTNANGMYKDWCKYVGTSTDMPAYLPRPAGVVVFKINNGKATHIGVHVGNNMIIEAKGCQYGVVITRYIPNEWHAWGYLDWINEDLALVDVPSLQVVTDASTVSSNLGANEAVSGIQSYNTATSSVIYREGDSGPEVEMITRRLWAEDNSVVISDFFDAILTQKIMDFQTANGTTADGLVGSSTWRRLFPVLQKKTGQQNGALAMQFLLNYQGYSVGTPDGLFGTGTETVLKAYQSDRELDADGICGDKTWRSLTLDEPEETQVIVPGGPMAAKCQLGDIGVIVTQVQNRLSLWRYVFPDPGTYDAYTVARVREFQNVHGITQDGIVGTATWTKMFPLLKKAYGVRDNVDVLQRALNYQRHIVAIDGMFGSLCEAAVIAYQTMRGLTADGIVGEATWASLFTATPTGANQYFQSSSGSTFSIYRFGDVHADIRQVKRRMQVDGLFSGTLDTVFDADLRTAIKSFQSSRGARVDGLIGTVTWSLLFPVVKKKTGQQDGAKAVQALLNLNGYSVGTPDGLFGTGSETKLIQFQTAKGLTPDGICGEKTWEKLCLI